jgi:phosphatidylglycerophosphatase A
MIRSHQIIATFFGTGYLRPAPGTWGSLASLVPGLILYSFFGPVGLLIGCAVLFVIGIWASQKFLDDTGREDDPRIVIDEAVGQWIALIPVHDLMVTPLLAFLLFRFFDIYKPWPVSMIDRKIDGAWGVMLDDVMAGLYAALCVWGVIHAGFG